jgi:hypothetical protein
VVQFERRNETEGFVRYCIVSEIDALGERRPVEVVGGRQKFHGPIPVTPPTLNLTVALGIVPAGCYARRADRSSEMDEKFGHELLRLITIYV